MEKTNENQQSESFYKYRRVTKCLSAGISFLTDNFLHIIKVSLPIALAFAVINAAIAYLMSDTGFIQTLITTSPDSGKTKITAIVILIALLILSFIVTCLTVGLIYRLMSIYSHDLPLKKEKIKTTLKASVKYAFKAFCFYLIPLAILFVYGFISIFILTKQLMAEGAVFPWLTLGIIAVIFIVIIVLYLPLYIAMPAMFLEKGKPVKNAINGYKKGLKIWGKIFCMALLLTLLVGSIYFVLSMPALTMISCYRAATYSIFNGDAVTIPSGFAFWYAVILFLTYYLLFFVLWLTHTPLCYLYASIKSDEIEEAKDQYKI